MPAKRGRGRYFLAAFLLALTAPFLLVLAVGAALTRVLLALSSAADRVARSFRALVAGRAVSSRRWRSERARTGRRGTWVTRAEGSAVGIRHDAARQDDN
jgi:hypothetical protein